MAVLASMGFEVDGRRASLPLGPVAEQGFGGQTLRIDLDVSAEPARYRLRIE
ncbi:MAG: hypothetical protein KatS3mg103_0024 [Phycisphaerales bacterium]|nr:MAG: hypothetical protein KatS3mg103_0024 [Phycisphaerales bacterium]